MYDKNPRCFHEEFFGAGTISAGTAFSNRWVVKDTSSAGAPTYAFVDGAALGELKLTLAATSEAEVLTLYWGDVLQIDPDLLQNVYFRLKMADADAVTTLVAGLAGDQNDAADSVAQNIWFRVDGATDTDAVDVETDDGTTDNDDKATGQDLTDDTFKRFFIDFTHGLTDVRFSMEDANGYLQRVAASTTFDVSGITGSLQPFFQLQKASGTGVPSLTIDEFGFQYKRF